MYGIKETEQLAPASNALSKKPTAVLLVKTRQYSHCTESEG
jgi:hypothetical protein